jgi:polygalacturonase
MSTNRRQILKLGSLSLAAFAPSPLFDEMAAAQETPRVEASGLLYPGQRAAGETSDTKRLQRAIDQAHECGGGTVYLAAGHYVSGSLLLRSNVSLWLDNGSILAMSADATEFLPAEKLTYDPGANQATSDFHVALLVGDAVEHIAVFGEGIIDCEQGKPKGGGPKPIALRRCMHVSLRGITIRNARNYNISMLGCQFVNIDGVTILNGHSDGIDPDCCRNVRIANCFIESVDDSLCLKASGALGERSATENVMVTNCVLRTASIHFKCGTESCGDFRNIVVSNCVFEGGLGMRHGNPGIALYTTDGGELRDVAISNIVMRDVGTPLAIIRGNRDRCSLGKGPGTLGSIRISNIIATGAKSTSVITGLPDAPVTDVQIRGVSITMATAGKGPKTLEAVPEQPTAYPQPVMFGPLPAFGLFLRHVENVGLSDVLFNAPAQEERPDIVADDVANLRLHGYENELRTASIHLWLNNVRDSWLECLAISPVPAHAYRVSGTKTKNLFLRGSGVLDWKTHLAIDTNVPRGSVQTSISH